MSRTERKALSAFDNCEVKKLVVQPTRHYYGELACAKYPEGDIQYAGYYGKYPELRTTVAINLGCLVCPYKDFKLADILSRQQTEASENFMQQVAIEAASVEVPNDQ